MAIAQGQVTRQSDNHHYGYFNTSTYPFNPTLALLNHTATASLRLRNLL